MGNLSPQVQAILDQITGGGGVGGAFTGPAALGTRSTPIKATKAANVSSTDTDKNPNPHTSVFHHILNVLMRGQAASAGAFMNEKPGQHSLGAAASGFLHGLEGKTHHDFTEVLAQHGVTGKKGAGLGIAADILGDPLTYAGGLGLVHDAISGVEAGGKVLTGAERAQALAKGLNPALGTVDTAKSIGKGVSHIVHNFGKPVEEIKAASAAAKAAKVAPDVAHETNIAAGIDALKGIKNEAPQAVQTPVEAMAAPVAKIAEAKQSLADAELPLALSKGSPKYGKVELRFPDDATRALYIVGGSSKSKAHEEYMQFLRGLYPHLDDPAIQRMGDEVKTSIKVKAAVQPNAKVLDVSSHPSIAAGHIAETAPEAAAAPAAAEPFGPLQPITSYKDLPQEYKDEAQQLARAELAQQFYKSPYSARIKPGVKLTLDRALEINGNVLNHPEIAKMRDAAIANQKAAAVAKYNEESQKAHEAANAAMPAIPAAITAKAPIMSSADEAKLEKLQQDLKTEQDIASGAIHVADGYKGMAVAKHAAEQIQKQIDDIHANYEHPVADVVAAHPEPNNIISATPGERLLATQEGLKPSEITLAKAAADKTVENIKQMAGYQGKFTAVGQVNLRNYIAGALARYMKQGSNTGKLTAEQQAKVARIYAHAEAMVEHAGYPAVLGPTDSQGIRLSSILPHLTPEEIVRGNHLSQIMMGTTKDPLGVALHQAALAAAHVEDANKIHPIIDSIATSARAIAQQGTVKGAAEFAAAAPAEAKATAQVAGASPTAIHAVGQSVKIATGAIKEDNPLLGAFADTAKATEAASQSVSPDIAAGIKQLEGTDKYLGIRIGTNRHQLTMVKTINVSKVARGVNKTLGLAGRDEFGRLTKAEDATLGGLSNYIQKFDHVFQTAFNTSYNVPPGMHDISKLSFAVTGTKTMDALKDLSRLSRETDSQSLATAWEKAKANDFEGPLGPLAQELHNRADNIFGANGLLRNIGVPKGMLNTYMKQVFRDQRVLDAMPFQLDHEVSGVTGLPAQVAHEYDSWRHWPPPLSDTKWKDPARQLLGLEAAAQKAAGRMIVMNHAAKTLGVAADDELAYAAALKHGWGEVSLPGNALKGVLFPPEMVEPMQKFLGLTTVGAKGDELLRAYDKGLRAFKISLTKYFPGHHINNSIGQTMMAFVADGLTPGTGWYTRAMKIVVNHAPVAAQDMGIIGPSSETAIQNALRFKGKTYSGDQVWQMFTNSGTRQAFAATNDELGGSVSLMNKISTGVQHFSDARENMQRLGHFMYLIEKDNKSKTLEEAVTKAAARVNEIHANYSDLTQFEKTYMRRLIPFYTWQRKVGPVLFKQMVTDPGRTLVFPKIQAGIGRMEGESNDSSNSFPQPHELVPAYLQDLLQVKYPGNLGYGGPRSPFADVVGGMTNNPWKDFVSKLTPLKDVAELGSAHRLDTGAAIKSRADYLGTQIPGVSTINSFTNRNLLTGFKPTHDATKYPDQQGTNVTAILNKLTGVPIHPLNTSALNSAKHEVKARQALVNARKPKPAKLPTLPAVG